MSVTKIAMPDYPVYWDDFAEVTDLLEKALDTVSDNIGSGDAILRNVMVKGSKIVFEFEDINEVD